MKSNYPPCGTALRWLARIWSVASIAFVLMFFIGEGFNPAKLTTREWTLFMFFPLGVMAGLLLGWWRELPGGALTVASFLAFYAQEFVLGGKFPRGPWLAMVAAPGLLFLLSGLLKRRRGQSACDSDAV